ncbi:MAG TPA: NAD-dependent dehydratase [Burkholderiaceae bacterium]|nr:NAD-dependent dehydratase [Burkholderiaceae bacterium]
MSKLLILGATGLVGAQLLRQALDDPRFERIVAPTRRPLAASPRLLNPIVDFDHLPGDAPWWHADALVCALGTTLAQAGSQEAFRRVDHDYVLEAARNARRAGTCTFVLNSSLGADPSAGSFYLRVKGETERDLGALQFDSLTLVRPSLLDGGPRPDSRPGEAVGLVFARLLRPVLPRRIRAVTTQRVAFAMLQAARAAKPGVQLIESDRLQDVQPL